MAITPLPELDRTSPTFRSECNAFFAGLIQQFTDEANATAAAMSAIAAGTAFAIPYTFSTTTTDADPGVGFLRLSSGTQNASTTIRADLIGADTEDWTSELDSFDDSTSTVKGQIRLVKVGDATKRLTFNVTAVASPSGYRNITVTPVGSSEANPFANNDSILLLFTRAGDIGNSPFSDYAQSADQTITSGGAVTIAHGLGTTPKVVLGFLKNITGENGYSTGDITPAQQIDAANNRGVSITWDATNIYIRYGSSGTAFGVIDKSTGNAATNTNANWKFLVRAWA